MDPAKAKKKLTDYFGTYKTYRYKKGEVIVRPDDDPLYIYYIKSGYVRVYRITEWGDVKMQIIYAPEQIFPIFWIFGGNQSLEYFEAVETTNLIKVPKSKFDDYIHQNPDTLIYLSRYLLSITKIISERADNLMFTDAYSRLISRLLHLATDFGERKGTTLEIALPMNQKDIAFSIAMTRETASRQLSKLERKRLITYKNHHIVIKDIEGLKEELVQSHERIKL